MSRDYVMRRRADTHRQTRERILQATMQLHDQQGVAPTTFADIAKRAGLGQATVYRHFPKLGDLVSACGAHVWQEMRPPVADTAAAVFEGLKLPSERVARLVEEIDGFYRRGELRLGLAARDRELIPELEGFLRAVEAGVYAYVEEALAPRALPAETVRVVAALMSFPAWSSFSRLGLDPGRLRAFEASLVECTIRAAEAS